MEALRYGLFLLCAVFLLCIRQAAAMPCLGDASAHRSYSVYLIPHLPATQLYRDWAPFLERLGREEKLCFDLNIPENFAKFENAIRTGIPDFALLNPYHQVMVAHNPGYVPLVRDGVSGLAGILVVRKDSGIRNIHQFAGRTVAFPAPNAYVASLLLRALLAREHVRVNADYVGSHSNVYRAVALGAVTAGGGANTTLKREPEELRTQLRVLYTSPYYISHPFSAHSRVPLRVRKRIITGFLGMSGDASGRALLKAIQMPFPVRANYNRDYRPLEKLDLARFARLEGP